MKKVRIRYTSLGICGMSWSRTFHKMSVPPRYIPTYWALFSQYLFPLRNFQCISLSNLLFPAFYGHCLRISRRYQDNPFRAWKASLSYGQLKRYYSQLFCQNLWQRLFYTFHCSKYRLRSLKAPCWSLPWRTLAFPLCGGRWLAFSERWFHLAQYILQVLFPFYSPCFILT